MKNSRWVSAFILLICGGVSIVWGFSIGRTVSDGPLDFQAVYYGARCLIQHHNPYNAREFEEIYRAEGGDHPFDSTDSYRRNQTVTLCINLPATLLLIAPFTALTIGKAQVAWMILTAASVLLAAMLIWNYASNDAPIFSVFLVGILLANCELIFMTGNTAGLVVSLCVVAAWCFLQERFALAGILCMAVSLAIKPHDSGLVWIYFILAGGVYRKRALQSLVVAAAIAMPAIVWVSLIAPHWIQDLHSNFTETALPGGINGAGPASIAANILGSVISLQTVVSFFRDDPKIYNPISYFVCGTLLAAWLVRTLKSDFSQTRAWLALAAITPLTMIITYHRTYDAKLLLLAVPACAMLWAQGGPTRWIALVVTTLGLGLTGDFPLTVFMILTKNYQIPLAGTLGLTLKVILMRPGPIILLAMSIFYLWAYWQPVE